MNIPAPPSALNQLAQWATFKESRARATLSNVAKRLTPYIRAELAIAWNRSGLKSQSGALYSASVTNADIVVTPKGFSVRMGSGDAHLYAAAGAFRYGAVRGSGGRKFKKNLKKNVKTGTHGVQASKPPYFQLQADRIQRLAILQAKFAREELKRQGL